MELLFPKKGNRSFFGYVFRLLWGWFLAIVIAMILLALPYYFFVEMDGWDRTILWGYRLNPAMVDKALFIVFTAMGFSGAMISSMTIVGQGTIYFQAIITVLWTIVLLFARYIAPGKDGIVTLAVIAIGILVEQLVIFKVKGNSAKKPGKAYYVFTNIFLVFTTLANAVTLTIILGTSFVSDEIGFGRWTWPVTIGLFILLYTLLFLENRHFYKMMTGGDRSAAGNYRARNGARGNNVRNTRSNTESAGGSIRRPAAGPAQRPTATAQGNSNGNVRYSQPVLDVSALSQPAQPAAKGQAAPAAKPAAQPAQSATKGQAAPAAKPAAQPAQSATKGQAAPAAKPAAQPTTKPATKPAAQQTQKPAAAAQAPAQPQAPAQSQAPAQPEVPVQPAAPEPPAFVGYGPASNEYSYANTVSYTEDEKKHKPFWKKK